MTTKITADPGSISSGTMRSEDLIPAFSAALDSLKDELITSCPSDFKGTEATKSEVSRIDLFLTEIERRQESVDDYWESEDADHDLDGLFDELQNFAPPYCSFSSHPGDGADYGFWVHKDMIADAKYENEILPVDDTSEVPNDYSGMVLHVNDHGNMTLFSATAGELSEIWSIV